MTNPKEGDIIFLTKNAIKVFAVPTKGWRVKIAAVGGSKYFVVQEKEYGALFFIDNDEYESFDILPAENS